MSVFNLKLKDNSATISQFLLLYPFSLTPGVLQKTSIPSSLPALIVLSLFKSPVLLVYRPFWGAVMLISTITKSQPIDILTERLFIDIFYSSVLA